MVLRSAQVLRFEANDQSQVLRDSKRWSLSGDVFFLTNPSVEVFERKNHEV